MVDIGPYRLARENNKRLAAHFRDVVAAERALRAAQDSAHEALMRKELDRLYEKMWTEAELQLENPPWKEPA